MPDFTFFIVIAGLIGLGQAVIGGLVLRRVLRMSTTRKRCVRGQALVVSVRTSSSRTGDRSTQVRYTKVRFLDARGRSDETEVQVGTSWNRDQTGQEIDILYDTEDPTVAFPVSNSGGVFVGVIAGFFVVLGTLIVIAAVVAAVLTR
jgi:hypothetical protein